MVEDARVAPAARRGRCRSAPRAGRRACTAACSTTSTAARNDAAPLRAQVEPAGGAPTCRRSSAVEVAARSPTGILTGPPRRRRPCLRRRSPLGPAPRGTAPTCAAAPRGCPSATTRPLAEQHHPVGQRDRGRTVGDDRSSCAPASPRASAAADLVLLGGIDRRGGVVEDRARGGRRGSPGRWRCAGAGRPRARTRARRGRSRSRRAARAMNSSAPGQARRPLDLRPGRASGSAKAMLAADRVAEQERVLEDDADRAAQVAELERRARRRRRAARCRRRRRRSGGSAGPRCACRTRSARPAPPPRPARTTRSRPSSTGRSPP